MKSLPTLMLLSALATVSAACAADLVSPEERARQLVAQMTLDEKISQIHMLDVKAHPREVPGIERLGIPAFKITNGPAGAGPGDRSPTEPATALPAALALAASWDTALAERFGQLIGQEVAARGEHLLEAPGVNIARVPQNGRNFEYFGEDPWLASRLAVAEIRGVQSERVIAEVKHFAANNQEAARKTINEVIDERTLREIYLPAFEAAVKEANVGAVMAAYPSVNGEFGCENTHLLQDILRHDWGFTGFVQSDYTATRDAVRSAHAGLDLAMKPDHYSAEMKAAVLNGAVPERLVDQMVARRLTQMAKFGMLDGERVPQPIPAQEHGTLAREIGEQCVVLLKNAGPQLPLDRTKVRSIAVIGPAAEGARTGGGGSSAVTPLYTVAPVDGIKQAAGATVSVTYHLGDKLNEATEAAKAADVAIVMVGNKDAENHDRTSLALPDDQDALIAAVAAVNPHTIVVLKTGGAVLMPWLDRVPAVLEAWYPGEEDGNIVAAVLFGAANPSGKLPLTFPNSDRQVPASAPEQYPGVNGTATYSERLLVGYRWYDERNEAPLFPFGFGLSYTTFEISHLSLTTPGASGSRQLSVEVRNTGHRAGAEVVQVYVSAPSSAGEPPRQLKGFAKVSLAPAETKRVTITLDPRAFSIWSVQKNIWVVVAGTHTVYVGSSSRNLPLSATVEIAAR
jgi:beta-glucosidase